MEISELEVSLVALLTERGQCYDRYRRIASLANVDQQQARIISVITTLNRPVEGFMFRALPARKDCISSSHVGPGHLYSSPLASPHRAIHGRRLACKSRGNLVLYSSRWA